MNHKAQLLDWDVLGKAISALHAQKRWNDLLTLSCATYTGCRPGDWRLFTWSVFMDKNGVVKEEVSIFEAKPTNIAKKAGRKPKKRQLFLTSQFRAILSDAWEGLYKPDTSRFIFKGTRGPSGNGITTNTANGRLKKLADEFGLSNEVTTYSFRKTGARRVNDSQTDVMKGAHLAKNFLGHTSVETTMRYIGLTPEETRRSFELLNF